MSKVLIGIIIIAILICFLNREQFGTTCTDKAKSREADVLKPNNTPTCITLDATDSKGKTTYFYNWGGTQLQSFKSNCEKKVVPAGGAAITGWTAISTEATDTNGKKVKLYCPN